MQTCIAHLIRNSQNLAAALKPAYQSATAEVAAAALNAFEQGDWGKKFPTVVAM